VKFAKFGRRGVFEGSPLMSFEQLVELLYQATTEPELWELALQHLCDSVHASAGALIVAGSDRWVGWRWSRETPAAAEAYMRSEISLTSQTTPRLMHVNRAGFVAEHEVFSDEEFLADPLMTELGTPAGLHHVAGTAIHIPTGDTVIVHIQRRVGLPRMEAAALAVLDGYRPHLARAGLLAVRWRLARLKAAAEALALVGLPAAVVDLRGRVLAANALIEGSNAWIAWLPGDRIGLIDVVANDMFNAALAGLGQPAGIAVRSVPVKATSSDAAAVVHVIPATGQARDLFGGAFGIVVITAVSTAVSPGATILRALFDLTPAEARIAAALAEGLTLDQIAARFSVSVETVRSQVKAVLAKTGTHRQAELAALLAGIPKIPVA